MAAGEMWNKVGNAYSKYPRQTAGHQAASGGMFGSDQPASFWTPQSGFEGATQPTKYDVGYISGGLNTMKSPAYQPSAKYNPYQFKRTSDQEFGDTYNRAMSVASTPVRAQGAERMRQATQGWGGNQMSGAAGKELAMKNAQRTGSDLADVGKSIGSNMATSRMAEGQEVQRQQASENFKAAGFSEDQAKAMADDIFKRAGAMVTGGQNWFTLQRQAAQDEYAKYNDSGFDDSWM